MHLPKIGRFIELFVDHGHGFHAMLALPKHRRGGLVGGCFGLQTQQAGDHLQVVLDAMVDLLDQDFFFGQRPSQPGVFLAQLANQPDFLGGLLNRQTQAAGR